MGNYNRLFVFTYFYRSEENTSTCETSSRLAGSTATRKANDADDTVKSRDLNRIENLGLNPSSTRQKYVCGFFLDIVHTVTRSA